MKKRCPDCDSIKILSVPERGNGKCSKCHGEGEYVNNPLDIVWGAFGSPAVPEECDLCSHTGQCQTCGGTGRVICDENEEVETEEDDNDEDDTSSSDYSSDYDYSTPVSTPATTPTTNNQGGAFVGFIFALSIISIIILFASKPPSNKNSTQQTAQQQVIQPEQNETKTDDLIHYTICKTVETGTVVVKTVGNVLFETAKSTVTDLLK